MEQSDAAAVARVLAGDEDAFRVLVERHSRTLFRLAMRMLKNEEDADEVVQETFLRAYKRLDRFEARSSFATWVYRIAVNCSLDMIAAKKQKGQEVPVGVEDEDGGPGLDLPGTLPDPERAAMGRQLEGIVASTLEKLSPAERTAFILRHYEGRSIEEVAEALGIKVGAAKNSVFRAVQKMREALEPAMRLS